MAAALHPIVRTRPYLRLADHRVVVLLGRSCCTLLDAMIMHNPPSHPPPTSYTLATTDVPPPLPCPSASWPPPP